MSILLLTLPVAGVITLALGILHFFFPVLLDFKQAIPRQGAPIRPFQLGPLSYSTQRSDVHGIAWVMNHAASYTLVSIGLIDLFAFRWIGHPIAPILGLWISIWWFLRAGSQFYLGRRRGDWLILAGFSILGLLHLGILLL